MLYRTISFNWLIYIYILVPINTYDGGKQKRNIVIPHYDGSCSILHLVILNFSMEQMGEHVAVNQDEGPIQDYISRA